MFSFKYFFSLSDVFKYDQDKIHLMALFWARPTVFVNFPHKQPGEATNPPSVLVGCVQLRILFKYLLAKE